MLASILQFLRRLGGPAKPSGVADPGVARPHVYMHIPKAGGTALISDLITALAPTRIVRGLDRCLFGLFDRFDTIDQALRKTIFTDLSMIPRDADLVVGHMAASTLRATYPTGVFMTSLREPISRLLSYWTYWRSFTEADLQGWGAWGYVVRDGGRKPLAEFLSDPDLACQTDNVVTRMLLSPHRLIPDGGFINPVHDVRLLREAQEKLRSFDFADIVELPDRAAISAFLGKPVSSSRANETKPVPRDLATSLHKELTPTALDRLCACSRLDLPLWRLIAGDYLSEEAIERILTNTLLLAGARHAALLAPDGPD